MFKLVLLRKTAELFRTILWSVVAYNTFRYSMTSHMGFQLVNYRTARSAKKPVYFYKVRVIIYRHQIVFPMKLAKISSNVLPWSSRNRITFQWFFLRRWLIQRADTTAGNTLFDVPIHPRPVEYITCSLVK